MAEQRVGVGEVRDGKDLKFGSSGETIAGEEVDSSAGDETSGEARDWKYLKFDSSGDKRSGEASLARDEKDLKFGDGGETADADEDVQKQDSIEFDDDSVYGAADDVYHQGWEGLGRNDDDFEPDTNRLDYFRMAPFDVVHGDDDLGEIGNDGGGGGGDTARILISSNNGSGDGDRNDRDMVVRPTLDQERASTGAGGQRLPVGISSTNAGGGGRRNREILLDQERGSSGGAGYMTQQDPIGISSNNGSGEMVIQNFEQERGGGFEWWIGGGGLWEKLWLLLALWKIV